MNEFELDTLQIFQLPKRFCILFITLCNMKLINFEMKFEYVNMVAFLLDEKYAKCIINNEKSSRKFDKWLIRN